ncbi:anaphase-promoting complex subunit 2 [Melanaphis sacchari]|uniref:Anaphase-promoting complex subunit 2 n=1 Tax=Melanaphis sacchari TaxID=742174 RepID=A0A2H8TG57_9HEMI|nr:anaphase-promoting complex subunit 2 [Melanaphis sacchari]
MDTNTTKSYWNEIVLAFPILSENDEECTEQCDDEQFLEIKKIIVENKLISFVHGMVMHAIKQDLMSKINDFWLYFIPNDVIELCNHSPHDDVSEEYIGFVKFKYAIDELFNLAQSYIETINRLQMLFESNRINLLKNLNAQICALLHSQLPSDYNTIIYQFYTVALKVFTKDDIIGDKKNTSKEGAFHCNGCGHDLTACRCDDILESFHLTNWQLITIGILEPLAGDVIMDLIHQKIETEVQEITKENFGEHHISALETWIDTNVYNWMKYIYKPKCSMATIIEDTNLAVFMRKLKHLLYESYTRTRIDQLFNIIIEYPDSEPAVIDLSSTLQKTDFKAELCKKLQNALHNRLLHPAVNTIDIITAYTAAIKVLRKIDPCGALLQEVTQPIRAYLRSRKDTVRCVMTTLTEEGHYLTDELVRNENVLDEDDVCEEESMAEWAKWMPDPVDANPSKSSKRFRNSDTVSMLVDIYGTRELFVNEYRALLADRLLTQFMDNIGDEIRYLELLKLRFGDSLLHSCSVMLKDVYDSKRINHHLYSDPTSNLSSNNLNNKLEFPVRAIIVSNQFWPNFKDNFNVELPSVIQEHLDNYTKAFESFKGNRTLNWKPNLGIINIDLELKDKTLNFTVSPIHATIIWHFQEQEEWTINDLSIKMRVPATTLRRRIGFWQNQGLLREKSFDTFTFVEDGIPTTSISGKGNRTSFVGRNSEFVYGDDDDEMESAVASAQDQREEELQVFWSYIVGMLTNLDSLPLDRIHQMLKMFATQGTGVDCSLTQLRLFLDEKVKQHLLIFTGGRYKLSK